MAKVQDNHTQEEAVLRRKKEKEKRAAAWKPVILLCIKSYQYNNQS